MSSSGDEGAATVLETKTRRRRPEQPERDRVITKGSRGLTDTPRERNREGKVSPELETKSDDFGRKRGKLDFSSNLHGRIQIKG